MVFFSVLLSGIGLAGFAALAVLFFQRELRRNLERDLAGALARAAPVLLRIADGGRPVVDDWMAARLEGRLEEFGAVYAVRSSKRLPWLFGPGWPVDDPVRMDDLLEALPRTSFPENWTRPTRPRDREQRGARRVREGGPPPPTPRDVRILHPSGAESEWMVAGLRDGGAAAFLAVPGGLNQPRTRRLVAVFLFVGPVALLLVGIGAFFLAGRGIAPIRRLSAVASSVTADDLSRRIDTVGMEREFSGLIEVFNGMLDRLERSFHQARRFGQDAAHELNTPLTVLTAKIDDAVAEVEDGSPEQVRLAGLGEEVRRLREIVRKLHLLARIDGGGLKTDMKEIGVARVVEEVISEMAEVFSEVGFSTDIETGLRARADVGLLRQILLNLLSNAGRYNRPEGWVRVTAKAEDGRVTLSVENSGPAVSEDLQERVFDRFSRGDPARGSSGGGLGLGLSLAREFARAMGGDLRLADGREDRIRFLLTLPGLPAPASPGRSVHFPPE